MASLSDLKMIYRVFMKAYLYRTYDWTPGATLNKPLNEARVAAVTTAAFHLPTQNPFDESLKGGDVSYREIPADADLPSLQIAHRSDAFDHSGIATDKNLALPIHRLNEMAEAGEIGSVNLRHFSFMGSIPAPGRLMARTAPEVAEHLKADGVDVVILTPV